jgi:hypothetical protein
VLLFCFDNNNMLYQVLSMLKPLENLRKVWEEGSFGPQLTILNTGEGDSGVDGCN